MCPDRAPLSSVGTWLALSPPRSTKYPCGGLLANIPGLEQAKSRSNATVNAPLVSFLEPCREIFDICEQASSVRSKNVRDKLSTNESDPARPLPIPRTRSELNPQRELSDAAASSVTGTSAGDLSEMAVRQVVAGVIEVYVVNYV